MRLLSAAATANLPAEGSRSGIATVREDEIGVVQGLVREVAGLVEEDGRNLGEMADPSILGERENGKRQEVDCRQNLVGEEITRARV